MPLFFLDLEINQRFDLGMLCLSEEEIISFAEQYDPMPFHTDREIAKQSPFGALIASGPHPFHAIYLREWVPRFKDSVFAGKGIYHWNLHLPVYANQAIQCHLEIKLHEAKPAKGFGVINWYFSFENEEGQLVQDLEMVVLHWLKPPPYARQ